MNTNNDTEKLFKGDPFLNRYRITGILKTVSPLHIGSGEEKDASRKKRKKAGEENESPVLVSAVLKDPFGKPLIPGSTLKGVMRHWLWSVLASNGEAWVKPWPAGMETLSQAEQQEKVKTEFGWLDLLFGTPFHEGKLEVWDATCTTKELEVDHDLLGWNKQSLTYEDTSVAIDPATGTAAEHLLYQFEVVPPGVEFEFNVCAQNLNRTELGLLLLVMQGYNSEIYPIQVGAHSGRGFGRMHLEIKEIKALERQEMKAWVKGLIAAVGKESQPAAAGHYALPKLEEPARQDLLKEVKAALSSQMGA